MKKNKSTPSLRSRLHTIIFEADTPGGKAFDVVLIILIILSVLAVILETVPDLSDRYGQLFGTLEWFFTIIFTAEYILRLTLVKKPWNYVKSFYGIVDLVSILPAYLSLFIVGGQSLLVIRALRLLRVFRIFKLSNYFVQGLVIIRALKASVEKILVFLFAVILLVIVFGSVMYMIEGQDNEAFDSIPRSIYWAIVTLTTVGYGDISPTTPLGQFIASMVMILGYAVIAVPTGIVTNELLQGDEHDHINTQHCSSCGSDTHDNDALYCKYCGEHLGN